MNAEHIRGIVLTGGYVEQHKFLQEIAAQLAEANVALGVIAKAAQVYSHPMMVRGEDRSFGKLSKEAVTAEVIEKMIQEIRSGRTSSYTSIDKVIFYFQKELVGGKEVIVMRVAGGE